jgi:UDP-N-acetylmuramoyl-L-alanyl-D-glutamate--2,6-diaminopimelate ligase
MRHLCSRLIPQSLKNILYHFPLAVFAAVYFGFPARGLRVIGVTGTNGKTTTTHLITKILQQAGKKVAMASTIHFELADQKWTNASKFTTLSPWQLQKFLRAAVASGCEYAVLEISSHALDQFRAWGIIPEIAVMTNVTREHLDYHRSMVAYRRAKRRLFERAKMAVVNLDMENPQEYLGVKPDAKSLTYSTQDVAADVYTSELVLEDNGASFVARGTSFRIHLPGRYNVENALASLGVAELLGIDLETAAQALASVAGMKGRMEAVANNRGLHIFIDYAVTPDSLEKLYRLISSRREGEARIIAVFGSCGERDRGKRPLMGSLVASFADVVILTNEDPYHENPERILDDIEVGIPEREIGKNYWRILDRREAIAWALSIAKPGDWVIVTGKGAEETLAIGDERLPWNERAVIEEELNTSPASFEK